MNDQKQPADEDQNGTTASGSQNGTADNANPATQNQSSMNEEDFAALKAELESTQTKLQEMTTITQRALADLQNYRRRSEEEKSSFAQYANAELILDLLPAIDNINRALQHEPKDAEWQKGVENTLKQLNQVMVKRGVKVMETVNQIFDPKMHEALLTGPGAKDIILQELEQGYMLGEKVLKRARVKVGDGQATS